MPVKPSASQGLLGTTVDSGPPKDVQPGSIVSLDLNKATCLATPDRRVALTFKNPTCRVPYDISEDSLQALKNAVALGKVVVGEPISRKPRKQIIGPYLEKVDKAERAEDLREVCMTVVRSIKSLDGLSGYEVLEKMAEREAEGQCRPEIMNYIGAFMQHMGGPMRVEEHPQDAEVASFNTEHVSDGVVASTDEQRTGEQEEALGGLI